MLDFCLMQTVAVTVAHREQVGMDAYAAPVYRLVEEVVEGCLVEPGATADLDASRPEGVTAALRVHFPKSYTASLARGDGHLRRTLLPGRRRPRPVHAGEHAGPVEPDRRMRGLRWLGASR